MTSALLRFGDFIFVLRPLILIPAWSFYLIGAAESGGRVQALPGPEALASLTGILIASYLLNQIFDRDSDRENAKCFYLSRGVFQVRTLVIMAMVFFVASSVAFQATAPRVRPLLLGALTLALVYSLPPLRLCARPFVDMIANAIGFGGIAFVLGFAAHGAPADAYVLAAPFVIWVAATFLHTAIPDVAGDSGTGKRTTVVVLGVGKSRWLALVLHAAAAALALALASPTVVWLTTATLPFSIWSVARRTAASSALVALGHTAAVTAVAIFLFPAYALLVVPLLIASRAYHRRRFGITYPGVPRNA